MIARLPILVSLAALATFAAACPPAVPAAGGDYPRLRAAAETALTGARARAASLDETARTVSLPSVEQLLEEADARARDITVPARDWDFVRRQLATTRAYAEKL